MLSPMASTTLLQRLRERLRRAQQAADEQRATTEDLQARLAADGAARRKTELDGDEVPTVDISKQLIQAQAKEPPKAKPGVATKAAAAVARRVRPNSQEALQAAGSSGSLFGPAASHTDDRFRHPQDDTQPPILTGAPPLGPSHHASTAAAPAPRRTFSLDRPSPFHEPTPMGVGSGLTGAPSLSPHEEDDDVLGQARRHRPSSHEALLALFSSGPVLSGASGMFDDRSRHQDHRPLFSAPTFLAPSPPPAAAPAPRRTFSLATPAPFDPPQPLSEGNGLSGAGGLSPHEGDSASSGWFGGSSHLEGAPPLTPRDD
jgi:hypothetical protein